MRRKRIAMMTVFATLATGSVEVSGPPAQATGPEQPLYGDVTGDGRTDRIDLISFLGHSHDCALDIRPGLPNGQLGAPTRHVYLELPDSGSYCPDMGTTADLDRDGRDEIVLTWFDGPPDSQRDGQLLVLADFRLAHRATGVEQPSYIGTSDFNGDGLEDIYEWTDQGDGFVTTLGGGNGPLAPGPIRWCTGIRPDFQLSEFNREPGADVVIAYADECATGQSGVVVLFGDGRAVHLQRSIPGDEYWSLVVRDVNGDNWPDVATVAQGDGETTWFLAVAGGGFVRAPRAVQDKLR